MYLILIVLPLINSIIVGLCGKHFGHLYTSKISVLSIGTCFFVALFLFYEVGFLDAPVYLTFSRWVDVEILNLEWGFFFDSLTVVMCVVVTFISFLVHIYSIEYMSHDPHLNRFMAYLSLFTFFMLILISADNFVQMFVGWEGVGLCSYLLINFWFTRIQANKAAIKAMVLNRIGDFSLVIGILVLFVNFKAFDYATIAVLVPFFKETFLCFFNLNFHMLSFVGLFLFIGAVGKSAQLGLHTWLPDAMEGPTPVSALIHAATMVTAGVFLITRTSFLFEYLFNILEVIVIIGAFTAFLAASVGLVQNDLKRVIAYSTCSQLGYMVFACGLSNYSVGMFHLTNHAFFKALLFLSAGSIIHSLNDEQDMRKMGGLKNLLPITYISIIFGSLALIGFPFLSGFYSKDVILETAYVKYNLIGYFSYFLGTIGAFFTAFYSTRLLYLTFLSKPNGYKKIIAYSQDSNIIIKFVLIILIIPTILIGYFSKDFIIGMGTNFFGNSIFLNLKLFNLFDAEFITTFYKTLPTHFSLLGFFAALFLYSFKSKFLFFFKKLFVVKKIYIFLNKKWFFDKFYNEFVSSFFFKFGYTISYKFIDRGVFETLGPTGLAFVALNLGTIIHTLQTKLFYHIILMILLIISIFFFLEPLQILLVENQINFFIFNFTHFFNQNLFNFNVLFLNLIGLLVLFYNHKI